MSKINASVQTVDVQHVVTARVTLSGDVPAMMNLAGAPFIPDQVRVTITSRAEEVRDGSAYVSGPARAWDHVGTRAGIRRSVNFDRLHDAPLWLLEALRDTLGALADQLNGMAGKLVCESCGTTEGVTRMIDPYDRDVNNRDTWAELCGTCEGERAADI